MEKLHPTKVKEKMDKEKVCFVDVRSEDEFKSGHVPGAVCVPLDRFEAGETPVPKDQVVILSCQSGRRSARAKEILKSKGFENIIEMEGGFSAWQQSGFPIHRLRKTIPVIRQVMITAGFLVALGVTLSLLVHPNFVFLSLFVGAGLMFAGISGWCGMAFLLEKMPWNRT
jgi:rhodanese-related sulfurtransferase